MELFSLIICIFKLFFVSLQSKDIYVMKITLFKNVRKKEVINRLGLQELADMIRQNPEEKRVYNLRLEYQFYKPQRMADGQIVLDGVHTVNLPRVCFGLECDNYKEQHRVLGYNGLVVIEVNDLKHYEDAVAVRNQVARMPMRMCPCTL